jgi:hypothetical protein
MTRWFIFIICVSVFFSFFAGPSVYSDQGVKFESRTDPVGSGTMEDPSVKEKKEEGRALLSAGEEEANGPCEVVSFEAYEENEAVLTPSGDYTVTKRRECANVTVRNIAESAKHIEDFEFTAALGDGSIAYGKFDFAGTDAKRPVSPGDTYSGETCFEGGSPILILNCAVK